MITDEEVSILRTALGKEAEGICDLALKKSLELLPDEMDFFSRQDMAKMFNDVIIEHKKHIREWLEMNVIMPMDCKLVFLESYDNMTND